MDLNAPLIKDPQGCITKYSLGVPQGVSTSAVLGMIVLEELKVFSIEEVLYNGYADEGVLFSDCADPHTRLENRIANTRLSLKKPKFLDRFDNNLPIKQAFTASNISKQGRFCISEVVLI